MLPSCSSRVAKCTSGSGSRAFAHFGFTTKSDMHGFYESCIPLHSAVSKLICHSCMVTHAISPHFAQGEYLSMYCGHQNIVTKRCQYPSGLTMSIKEGIAKSKGRACRVPSFSSTVVRSKCAVHPNKKDSLHAIESTGLSRVRTNTLCGGLSSLLGSDENRDVNRFNHKERVHSWGFSERARESSVS